MDYTYKTKNVCSMAIQFHIKDYIITNVRFADKCNGNLKVVSNE